MRKIKKFKVPVYHYDIYRKAKKNKLDIDASHLNGQEGLKEFVSVLISNIDTLTVFDHIKSDSALWPRLNIENKQYAATLGFLSFGSAFREKSDNLNDELEKSVSTIASHVIMLSAIEIIRELSQQEASLDGFEVSKPYILHSWKKENLKDCLDKEFILDFEDEFLKELAIKLDLEKEGISLENKDLNHICFYMIPWISKKKK